jgi:DHA1 family bicyclomycin/chloramphenicol resistance-like MFS transporter
MQETAPAPRRLPIPFAEFTALMASLIALTAFSIDGMLPALPDIGRALGLGSDNSRQLIITFYLLGFASGQLICGPLSDRYGRIPVLTGGLILYAAATLAAVLAPDAITMFLARAMQGFAAAGPRIMATAIVRDCFAGRQMARVMSFVMMVFMVVPVLAPAAGEGIMQLLAWRWIFAALLIASLLVLVWARLRLRETLHPEARLPLSPVALVHAFKLTISNRQTFGYALALGCVSGILMSYITSAEQVFVDVYKLGAAFPLIFGVIASAMIAAAFLNSRIVERKGMRRVSHLALAGFLCLSGVLAVAGFPRDLPLPVFAVYAAAVFFAFGLIAPNFNALAMEPMGHIAGTASSLLGFYISGAGAVFGWLAGQAFDGSVRPLCIAFTLLALAALVIVLITERFQFAVSHAVPPPRPEELHQNAQSGRNFS